MKITAELSEIIVGLHIFFQDYEKIAYWLNTKNLNFGGYKPIDLIARGRGHKVLQFIDYALDEGGHLEKDT